MAFKKGQSGNPKGRPALVIPKLYSEVERNKQAMKQLILLYLNMNELDLDRRIYNPDTPLAEKWIQQIIITGMGSGDIIKFRMLLELVFGKIPEIKPEIELTPQEEQLIQRFREKLAGQTNQLADGSNTVRGITESKESV